MTFTQLEKSIDARMRKTAKPEEKKLYARVEWLVGHIRFIEIQKIIMGNGTWLYEGPDALCNELWMGEAGHAKEIHDVITLTLDDEVVTEKRPTHREIKYLKELEQILEYLSWPERNPYVYPKDFMFTRKQKD